MGMHQMLGPSFGAGADYEIERSLRFNAADSANLSKSFSSAGNTKTWTWSAWVKFNNNSGTQVILNSANGNNFHSLYLNSNSKLKWDDVIGGSNVQINLIPDLLIRDFAAWYHIVLAVDTTQSTAADRNKMYINGVQVTYESGNNFGQNDISQFNQGSAFTCNIGSGYNASYTNAYLADVQFIDGTQLAASSFAEYDDDNNWIPKRFSGSYGSNGYHLKFADNSTSAALGTDSSGNNNTWTVNNLVAAGGVALPGARTAVFFDGTDDKIVYTNNSDLEPSNGNFTLEFFIYKFPNEEAPIYYGTAAGHLGIRIHGTGKVFIERINTAFDHQSAVAVSDETWTHVAISRHAGTMRIFVNGSQISSFSNSQTYTGTFATGRTLNDNRKFAISDLHFIKGTGIYTSNFTAPTSISSHANTKLLCFQNASSATTATAAPYGVTLTATSSPVPGAYPTSENYQVDSLLDSPSNYEADSGNNGGNYATLNGLNHIGNGTLSNGNLDVTGGSGTYHGFSTIGVSSGKWYAEITCLSGGSSSNIEMGIVDLVQLGTNTTQVFDAFSRGFGYRNDGYKITNNSASSYGATYGGGGNEDVIGMAADLDNGTLTFYKNGVSQGTAFTGIPSGYTYHFATFVRTSADKVAFNFGQRQFAHTPPTNHLPLVTTNLSAPTIADSSTAFNIKTWTGTGSSHAITGYGFSPDFAWIKSRNNTASHALLDTVRGNSNVLRSDNTTAENTGNTSVWTSFDSDGFTLGADNNNGWTNWNTWTYVGWAWDAGTTTASNTDGSITTNVRASQANGFSIATYTGNGSANQTLGHGLGAAPAFVIIKDRTSSQNWAVLHTSAGTLGTLDGGTNYALLELNATAAARNASYNTIWHPTNTTVKIGEGASSAHWTNKSGDDYVMYSWTPISQFSAFGSFEGNGNADGPFVGLSFQPAFIIIKNVDNYGTGYDWFIFDTARDTFNVGENTLKANLNAAETDSDSIDILSNGFKIRTTANGLNLNAHTHIYAAFAEHPFKTARAR